MTCPMSARAMNVGLPFSIAQHCAVRNGGNDGRPEQERAERRDRRLVADHDHRATGRMISVAATRGCALGSSERSDAITPR